MSTMLGRISAALAFAGFLALAAGCSETAGQKRTAGGVEALRDLRDALNQGSKQIDLVLAALDKVVATASTDPTPAYAEFRKELATLDSYTEKARSRSAAMKARTEEYIKAWETELEAIKNPELQKRSDERRAQAREKFTMLKTSAQTVRDNYKKFQGDLHDIQSTLDLDLNAGGIASVKDIIDKAKEEGKAIMSSLNEFASKVDEVANTIAPKVEAKQPPAGAPAGAPPADAPKT